MGVAGGIVFVFVIIFMVMFHEFGHYVTAKRFGMKVTDFFFGFGPKLWSTRPTGPDGLPSETQYGVRAIPAGGYVKITGMNPLEEIPPDEESRTFRGKPAGQKLVVLVAGSATHFITGLVLLVVIFSGLGRPGAPVPVLEQVVEIEGQTSPAQIAGLLPGDRIVSVDGVGVTSWSEVAAFIAGHPGKQVAFGVDRGGSRIEVSLTLLTKKDGGGALGVVAQRPIVRDPLHIGVWHSLQAFWETGYAGLKGLFGFFSPSSLSEYFRLLAGEARDRPVEEQNRVVSLVGAVQIGSQLDELQTYLGFVAAMNIFVGFLNLLPLFPFDGGWVAVTVYEKGASLVRRRKVSVDFRRLVPLTYAVVAVLAFLFVTSLYLDIAYPIRLDL